MLPQSGDWPLTREQVSSLRSRWMRQSVASLAALECQRTSEETSKPTPTGHSWVVKRVWKLDVVLYWIWGHRGQGDEHEQVA
jgi:hypothetical protein